MGKVERLNSSPLPMPAVARILSRFDREQLAAFMEVAVELIDVMEGDPELEDDDPAEANGDEADAAWIEWHTMRGSQKRGPNLTAGHEDDEEDDPSGQCDEDGVNTDLALAFSSAPGCPISDPDYAADDVPCDEMY
jgi:hypothetical protein